MGEQLRNTVVGNVSEERGITWDGNRQASPRESSAIGKPASSRGRGHGSADLDELLIALVQLRTLDQMAHQ
ncbi:hypothetical protein V493_08536 [Pseudogymnoascus sp. VKM F-4281 (FW-2241)]|nr:hypothetical protein V493_08536 [Pseudogymnoascus sp. VKM F-4281 (FW-2241)]